VIVRGKGPTPGSVGVTALEADVNSFGVGIGNGIGIGPNRIDSGGGVRRYNADP